MSIFEYVKCNSICIGVIAYLSQHMHLIALMPKEGILEKS